MGRGLIIVAVFLSVVFVSCVAGISYAQEGQARQGVQVGEMAQEEVQEQETEYTYGIVTNVSPEQITIKEYDYDKEAEIEVGYAIGTATTFENVESAENITVGDYVDIDYTSKDGKRMATSIIVEKQNETEVSAAEPTVAVEAENEPIAEEVEE